jgi:XRE family transcriptional regulator, regulator of sulfur utilization
MVRRPTPGISDLGRAIRELREERGMTIEGLAREAQVDVAHLSRAENHGRNLTWGTLTSIAGVLDVSLSTLVSRAEEIAARRRPPPA